MKKILFLVCFVLVFPVSVTAVAAEKNLEWLVDKNRLEKLVGEKKCSEYWDILWPWAKKGNAEARTWLFILMAPPPEMEPIFAPGNSYDLVTKIRNLVIMAAHSHDHKGNISIRDDYEDTAYELYKMVGFDKSLKGREFLECTKSNGSKNCIEIAVKGKLVPAFKDFAIQIDAFMENGMKSKCMFKSR